VGGVEERYIDEGEERRREEKRREERRGEERRGECRFPHAEEYLERLSVLIYAYVRVCVCVCIQTCGAT